MEMHLPLAQEKGKNFWFVATLKKPRAMLCICKISAATFVREEKIEVTVFAYVPNHNNYICTCLQYAIKHAQK